MNRLLEFNPGDEAEVVTRILVAVHQAIDANFENAAAPPRRFTKTTFTDQLEDTNLNVVPSADGANSGGGDVAVTKEKMIRLDRPPERTDEEPQPLQAEDDTNSVPTAAQNSHKQQQGGESLFFSNVGSSIPEMGDHLSQHQAHEFTDLQHISRPKSKFLKALVVLLILAAMIGLATVWLMSKLSDQNALM